MPAYIFDPIARAHPKLTFQTVSTIAELFDTSVTTTAIRLVEGRHSPALLVCHGPKGRKWFTRSPDVPERWFPQDDLDSESFAFDILFGNQPNDPMPRKIGADAWFDRRDADRFEVMEQTFRAADDEILTLVLIREARCWRSGTRSGPSSAADGSPRDCARPFRSCATLLRSRPRSGTQPRELPLPVIIINDIFQLMHCGIRGASCLAVPFWEFELTKT